MTTSPMLYPPMLRTGKKPVTLIRRSLEQYVNGRLQASSETQVNILANVQPVLKSTATQMLEQIDRSKAVLELYSKDEIRMRREGSGGWNADRFTWNGELFEVMKVVHWNMGVLDHYHAVAMRVELT